MIKQNTPGGVIPGASAYHRINHKEQGVLYTIALKMQVPACGKPALHVTRRLGGKNETYVDYKSNFADVNNKKTPFPGVIIVFLF